MKSTSHTAATSEVNKYKQAKSAHCQRGWETEHVVSGGWAGWRLHIDYNAKIIFLMGQQLVCTWLWFRRIGINTKHGSRQPEVDEVGWRADACLVLLGMGAWSNCNMPSAPKRLAPKLKEWTVVWAIWYSKLQWRYINWWWVSGSSAMVVVGCWRLLGPTCDKRSGKQSWTRQPPSTTAMHLGPHTTSPNLVPYQKLSTFHCPQWPL